MTASSPNPSCHHMSLCFIVSLCTIIILCSITPFTWPPPSLSCILPGSPTSTVNGQKGPTSGADSTQQPAWEWPGGGAHRGHRLVSQGRDWSQGGQTGLTGVLLSLACWLVPGGEAGLTHGAPVIPCHCPGPHCLVNWCFTVLSNSFLLCCRYMTS